MQMWSPCLPSNRLDRLPRYSANVPKAWRRSSYKANIDRSVCMPTISIAPAKLMRWPRHDCSTISDNEARAQAAVQGSIGVGSGVARMCRRLHRFATGPLAGAFGESSTSRRKDSPCEQCRSHLPQHSLGSRRSPQHMRLTPKTAAGARKSQPAPGVSRTAPTIPIGSATRRRSGREGSASRTPGLGVPGRARSRDTVIAGHTEPSTLAALRHQSHRMRPICRFPAGACAPPAAANCYRVIEASGRVEARTRERGLSFDSLEKSARTLCRACSNEPSLLDRCLVGPVSG
jgi:hypothetical protein